MELAILSLPQSETMTGKLDARIPEAWARWLVAKYGDMATGIRTLIRDRIAEDLGVCRGLLRRQQLSCDELARRIRILLDQADRSWRLSISDDGIISVGPETNSVVSPMTEATYLLLNRTQHERYWRFGPRRAAAK